MLMDEFSKEFMYHLMYKWRKFARIEGLIELKAKNVWAIIDLTKGRDGGILGFGEKSLSLYRYICLIRYEITDGEISVSIIYDR